MAGKGIRNGKASSLPAGLAIGLAVSLGITALGSAVFAWLLVNGRVGENATGYGAIGILLCASMSGAGIASSRIQHRRMAVCMLSGTAYYASLLCITALLFGGQYTGMGVTALVVLAGSLATGLLGLRSGSGKRIHRRKYVSR